MEEISGTEAIARMRQIRHTADAYFTMHHLTWNETKQEAKGLRVVERCKLRPALPNEKFALPGDLYLPYMDLDLEEPRTCFKKLIRFVAFPPLYKLQKVNWFQ